jgi:hypothetical protein
LIEAIEELEDMDFYLRHQTWAELVGQGKKSWGARVFMPATKSKWTDAEKLGKWKRYSGFHHFWMSSPASSLDIMYAEADKNAVGYVHHLKVSNFSPCLR